MSLINHTQKMLAAIAQAADGQTDLAIPLLLRKSATALQQYPEDQTLGMVAQVLYKMAEGNKNFITRAQLHNLYQQFYARNTNFGEVFQNELNLPAKKEPVKQASLSETVVKPYLGDTGLHQSLTQALDQQPVAPYSEALAKEAKYSVFQTLDSWNLNPAQLSVVNGNSALLVVRAEYDTPKGRAHLYLPVEIKGGKAQAPICFLGKAGAEELNHLNIKKYLTAYNQTEVKKVAELVNDVSLPESPEAASFEQQLSSDVGKVAFLFGNERVKTAINYLSNQLRDFGYSHPQVAIKDCKDKTVFCTVSLNGGSTAFTVPVKMGEKNMEIPTIMICNGTVMSFDRGQVDSLVRNKESDLKAASVASPMFGLKNTDLIDQVRQAMIEGNHQKAEDALNVLSHREDGTAAYGVAFNLFKGALDGSLKKAANVKETGCSRLIKNSKVSTHPICGHTGLPVNKVYQDEYGNCRPLHRRDMEQEYQASYFMSSKVLV